MKSKKIKSLLLSAVVAVTSALSFGAVTASAASPIEFTVASVDAAPGETVAVPVSVKNLPDNVTTLGICVAYDQNLVLKSVLGADACFDKDTTNIDKSQRTSNPYYLIYSTVDLEDEETGDPIWIEHLTGKDGVLFTMNFELPADAKGEYKLSFDTTYDQWVVAGSNWDATITNSKGEVVGGYVDCDLDYKVNNGTITIACKEHKWSEWTTVTESTCKEAGKKSHKCTVCGKEETEDLELAAHTLTKTDAVAASCKDEKDGTEAYWKCSVCGKMFSDADGKTEITAPVAVKWAHKWGEKVETKAATCTEKGEATAKCENCGKEDTIEIAALGHDWSAWKVTKEATTEEEGEEERTCSRCEEKETKVIPVKTADPEPDTPVDEDDNNNDDFNWFVAPSYDPNAVNLGNRESAAASDAGTTPAASADEKETEVKADDKDQNDDAVIVGPTDDTKTDEDTGDNGADIEIEDDNTDIAIDGDDGDDGVDAVVDETPDDNSGSANSETDATVVSNAESSNPVTGVASNVGVAVVFGLIAAGAGAFAITKKTRK